MRRYAVGFIMLTGLLWAIIVMPILQTSMWWHNLNPLVKFAVYNLGFYFITAAVIGLVMNSHGIVETLYTGLGAFVIFTFTLDMIAPPFALDPMGNFIIATGATLEGTSVDYVTAWFWQHFGFSGPALYYMTYAVTPLIAALFFIIVLGTKRYLRALA